MRFPIELKLRGTSTIKASVWVVHVAAALALFHVPAFREWGGGGVDGLIAAGAWGSLLVSLLRGLRTQAGLVGCTVWLEGVGALVLAREPGESGGLGSAGEVTDLRQRLRNGHHVDIHVREGT